MNVTSTIDTFAPKPSLFPPGVGLAADPRRGVSPEERGHRPKPPDGARLPKESRDVRGSCAGRTRTKK